MKRIYYTPVLIFLMSLVSCKDYLETKPTDFLNPGNFYTTEAQLLAAKASAYNNLGANQLHGAWANYLYDWHGEEGYMNRLIIHPGNYFYSSSENYSTGLWGNLWDGINRVNVVLANVNKNPEIRQEIRDVVRGEVLFLRAYYYFTLVQYYGGVPLKIEPTSSVIEVDVPRASLEETYRQIIKDLEEAEPLVLGIADIGHGGQVSKSAVRGMLARVNLHMAGAPLNDKTRYAETRKWAKMVMDDAEAGHNLNPSYPDVFIKLARDEYDIKESIWEVEFWGNRQDQYIETGNIGAINGIRSTNQPNGTGGAEAYVNITSRFYDVFEPGDNRKWWNIAHFYYLGTTAAPVPNGTKNLYNLPATQEEKNRAQRFYPGKWRREFEVLYPKHSVTTPQNYQVLRFSDILLTFAEAENEINDGSTTEAIEAVNRVRRRAWSTGVKTITVTNGGSGYTSVPVVTFSDDTGSGATATAKISGGKVTTITLNRDLTGVKYFQEGDYSSVPTITISGGGGTGAEAIVTVYSKDEADLTAEQTASKESFLALIQDERMRELGFEKLRKGDLLRWGIFLEVYQKMTNRFEQESPGALIITKFKNATERDLLMPIPEKEITTNRAMVQNLGWN